MIAISARCTNRGSVSGNDFVYATYYIQKNGSDVNYNGFTYGGTTNGGTSRYYAFKVTSGDTFSIRRKTAAEETNPDAVGAGYYTSIWSANMQIFFAY